MQSSYPYKVCELHILMQMEILKQKKTVNSANYVFVQMIWQILWDSHPNINGNM